MFDFGIGQSSSFAIISIPEFTALIKQGSSGMALRRCVSQVNRGGLQLVCDVAYMVIRSNEAGDLYHSIIKA